MTESGTPPPPRRNPAPQLCREGLSGAVLPSGLGRTLIDFEPGTRGSSLVPHGIVHGRTDTRLFRSASSSSPSARLPKVVVRPPLLDDAFPKLGAMDELVVGAPEPADWVRLEDPRHARTVPSIRRRIWSEAFDAPEAPTTVEPSPGFDRERLRGLIALGVGGVVAVLGLSSLIVTSLLPPRRQPGSESLPVESIAAAQPARLPENIPAPPAAVMEDDPAVVRIQPASDAQPRAAVLRTPEVKAPRVTGARGRAAGPSKRGDYLSAEESAALAVRTATRLAIEGSDFEGTDRLRTTRSSSGLRGSIESPARATHAASHPASSASPRAKKRLWFPPK